MLGRTHALSGWCAGLALAPTVGLTRWPEVAVFAATSAGYALAPDLDHPGATASKLLGPITGVLSRLLRAASAGLYRLTKGPRDENCSGKHRHLSHTLLFALALGAATWWGSQAGGHWAVLGVVLFGLMLAENALGDWVALATGSAVALVALSGDPVAALDATTGWVGLAVAAGCVVHCLGDMVTKAGVPILTPLPIRGETWAELSLGPLSFRTGKGVEKYVVFPVFAVLGVVLLPGVGSALV